jgi:hypothetical protein
MTDFLLDPYDVDHGEREATRFWVVAAMIALILVAMVIDVTRSAGMSLVRLAGGAKPMGEIGTVEIARQPS